jgi:hypothetical protein
LFTSVDWLIESAEVSVEWIRKFASDRWLTQDEKRKLRKEKENKIDSRQSCLNYDSIFKPQKNISFVSGF